METLGDKNPAFSGIKNPSKFYCEICDFVSSKKSHYREHLSTLKHKNTIVGDAQLTNSGIFRPDGKFKCNNCSRAYQSRNGLWKHQKKCCQDNNLNIKESIISDKELMVMLIKQNEKLMNIVETGTHNTNNSNNNNNNNSHNKTFNLQFFLNETCKNAMNIDEFVSSIKPQLCDLEATGRLGYVEGVSKIILKNLNNLNTHDRPFHCSDQKREIIYIKDNDEWQKEEENKPILTKAIKVIANENIKNIREWRKGYPDCTDSDSKKNDLYLNIVSNSMSGSTKDESEKNINKIISNVAKQVVIDKTARN
jgi:hypothetical protein